MKSERFSEMRKRVERLVRGEGERAEVLWSAEDVQSLLQEVARLSSLVNVLESRIEGLEARTDPHYLF